MIISPFMLSNRNIREIRNDLKYRVIIRRVLNELVKIEF